MVVQGALIVAAVAFAAAAVFTGIVLGALAADRVMHRRCLAEVARHHGAGAALLAEAEFVANGGMRLRERFSSATQRHHSG
ncbi:hypothetical protein [Actinomycetospora flava]|uniref:Uncharacterized protein n=1 Tax=Actinomycetospora flava TaxID=3129232 RepID=A0ABU8MEW1_9PSEU